MILADKIIRQRKRNGWSQEELAEKLNVSRQAVSKWEGAQTVPDLEKILKLAELFGVTTDYLLKDDIEAEEYTDYTDSDIKSGVKCITLEEANSFLAWREKAAVKIAIATFICIFAVIPLLILGAASEEPAFKLSEVLACGIGLIFMFVAVTVAVAIFVYCGFKNSPYEFIDKEPFETAYGVTGMVRDRKAAYKSTYSTVNIIATCICVISPVALFIGAFSGNDFLTVILLGVTILLAGIGTFMFIIVGVRWASMEKLLKEGEFSVKQKEKNRLAEAVGTIYWLVATAIFLGWSFACDSWEDSWIVWPVAGVVFAVVMTVCNLCIDKGKENQ